MPRLNRSVETASPHTKNSTKSKMTRRMSLNRYRHIGRQGLPMTTSRNASCSSDLDGIKLIGLLDGHIGTIGPDLWRLFTVMPHRPWLTVPAPAEDVVAGW